MASSSPGSWFYVSAGIGAISDLNARRVCERVFNKNSIETCGRAPWEICENNKYNSRSISTKSFYKTSYKVYGTNLSSINKRRPGNIFYKTLLNF